VTFGLFKRNDPNNGGKPKADRVKVKRVIKHPKWKYNEEKNRWMGYDLAIIELERRVKFKPIKMHDDRDPPDGYRIQTYGFGNTAWKSGAPTFLQGTTLVFNERATKKARPEIIRAGEKGKATCHGDSGGPLVYNVLWSDSHNTNVTPKLIATNTFTVVKCHAGALMGFTRLDMNWIKKVIR
jgi:secreted trypsin-like serine protease